MESSSIQRGGGPFDIIAEPILAHRWGKSVRTLQRLRARGDGPAWFAIGRSVFYRLEDVLAFEAAARQGGTR